MWMLFVSIGCSVAVSVLLKLARQQQLVISQSIAVNYVIASLLTLGLLQPQPQELFHTGTPYGVIITLGVLLPSVFLIMAMAIKEAGIVLTDAAQRLSLVLPLIAAVLLFGESIQSNKLLGVVLGLVALVCLTLGTKKIDTPTNHRALFSLMAVWIGFGVIDILFKQVAKSGANFSSSLFIIFIIAGILLFTWLIIKKTQWNQRSIYAGFLLGLLNFGNIYFYLRAHQKFPENPSLVFSTMNIGVITLGTLVGAGLFKEKLRWISVLGIALAIAAIWALFPR